LPGPTSPPRPVAGRLKLVFAAVLLLAMAPMAGLLWHVAETGRDDQKLEAKTRLMQAARFAVAAQSGALAGIAQTLAVLADRPADWADDPETCRERMRTLVEGHPFLVAAVVTRRSGQALCSNREAVAGGGNVNLSDRTYWRSAIGQTPLSVGAPVESRFSGNIIVPVALRIPASVGQPGDPPAVIAAVLDIERIARQIGGTQGLRGLQAGGVVKVFDTNGRMLLQHPRDDRATAAAPPFVSRLLAAQEGVLEAAGHDGQLRLIGFAHATEADLVYAVSVLSESVTHPAAARFRDVIALAVLAAFMGLIIALWITQWRVLSPVALLAEAAAAVESGAARAMPDRRLPGEFELLRRAMQAMLQANLARADSLSQANRELERLAGRDALTGLANRRAFDAHLADAWTRSQRSGESVAIAIFDVDFFKKFNDRYGHLRGDDCLRKVAESIGAIPLRERDLAARLGGEEFVLLLPATDTAGAAVVAERALEAIRDRMILHEDHPAGMVTASVGVAACRPMPGIDPAALLAAADTALYRAKETGRDRMVTARDVAQLPLAA
jgi:diguanylate cyclase (GGDEF)-like protein